MDRVFLAEKKSIGLAIADTLGGPRKVMPGWIELGGRTAVTWLAGHLLELWSPGEYDSSLWTWRREQLPIVPEKFRKKERGAAATRQLGVVAKLIRGCPVVVHAGDFDREGQLLGDEALEHLGYAGTVLRLGTKSLDRASLARELGRLRPNSEFRGWSLEAEARSEADWLCGLNVTRAASLHVQACGGSGTFSAGRVQTPTLALVRKRDQEIRAFRPRSYFQVRCLFKAADGRSFEARLLSFGKEGLVDGDGRIFEKAAAEGVVASVAGRKARVSVCRAVPLKESPPLPYSLTELQKEASSRYGLKAAETLACCQKLYEGRFQSYPRTDSRYLPEEQFCEAGGIVDALKGAGLSSVFGENEKDVSPLLSNASVSLKNPVWDTSKISAHHAIIPTSNIPTTLFGNERLIYFLVVSRYLQQFLPACEGKRIQVRLECGETQWGASVTEWSVPGWRKLAGLGEKGPELPPLRVGEEFCADFPLLAPGLTRPPQAFTDGSLMDAMENVARYVEGKDAKAVLVRTAGLGTVASRAAILESLFRHGYLRREGKKDIHVTKKGELLLQVVPNELADPLLTAEMEERLEGVQRGEISKEAFVGGYIDRLPLFLEEVFKSKPDLGLCAASVNEELGVLHSSSGGFASPKAKKSRTGSRSGAKPEIPVSRSPQRWSGAKAVAWRSGGKVKGAL